ncbi:MAG: Multicopper oxidase type 2 [Chthoniobacteraceae bacterium]|nr:Multicopper oxidase type 2 [Chthoniobacteraceae bacterium]
MTAPSTFPLALVGFLSLLIQPLTAAPEPRADAAIQAWAAHAGHIKPTVTKEMGDVGGKSFGLVPDPARIRRYYIAAEIDAWDFAPEKLEAVCGMPVPAQVVAQHTAMKIRYFQYTDETFTAKLVQTPRLGVLGPVLRGVVGEYLMITFLNRTDFPLSMHPHGVKYDKDSEGAFYSPGAGLGSAVGAGAKFTYVWHLDDASGPLPGEPSSKCWLYHSHVSGDEEANLGLVGFIIVTDPARARPDGTPNDVDRERASLFMIFSESGYDEEAAEMAEAAGSASNAQTAIKSWAESQEERELGFRYAINGYIFGNLPGLEVNEGERVRWYLFGLGDEQDMHTAHWHGLRVIEENRRRTDVIELLPASMKVADMLADNPGTWLYHCHVAEHMQEGMFSRMVVHPRGSAGVSRAPAAAFFGLPEGAQSLRITSATLVRDPGAKRPPELRILGNVTVFDAFSVFTTAIRIGIGEKWVTLKPARNGQASAEGVSYRVINSGRYGVVYGGLMEWEATFTGESWATAASKASASIKMELGKARHAVPLPPIP